MKRILAQNLSLASKLTLRRAARIARTVLRIPWAGLKRIGNVAHGRGIPLPRKFVSTYYDPQTPATALRPPSTGEIQSTLQSSRAQLLSRKTIQSSIIIPVFNKAEFTQHCLYSLLREIDLSETEIIVVNNASTDTTADVLSTFGDLIRVINNEQNLGFVGGSNQGADAAAGQFLVFLNNDTQVLPGWLDQLIRTIKRDPRNGAVGSLFLYPDGSIQEAGAIVWRNGEAHHYGWSESPNDRRFNFAREVDYCSAASLLVRKEVFEQLGGFDRRYMPAYYEDIDLCFGVRALGYKVLYQPASRLIHYEGATAGRDVNTGFKQFQVTNRRQFVEKWRNVLEGDHFEKDLKRVREAAHRLLAPVVLVFDERFPTYDRDAGSARMLMILKSLAQWRHVIFLSFYPTTEKRYEDKLVHEGIETGETIDFPGLLRTRNVGAAVVSRPLLAEVLIPRLRQAQQRLTIVFDMVDAHFIRLAREAAVANEALEQEAARFKKLEVKLAGMSDLIWCNSNADQATMQQEVYGKRIEVVPTIHELHDRGESFANRKDLLFVGNFAHRPNVDGIHFFMREVFPLVQRSLPGVKLYLIGDCAPVDVAAYDSESVKVMGYVADVAPFFETRRVFIAPVRFGAGVKGKVGEAMSYGLPLVTTTIGAEGFGLQTEVNVMIADDAGSFASAVTRLYNDQDLWERLAANSHRHIAENFTPAVIAKTINRSLREAISVH